MNKSIFLFSILFFSTKSHGMFLRNKNTNPKPDLFTPKSGGFIINNTFDSFNIFDDYENTDERNTPRKNLSSNTSQIQFHPQNTETTHLSTDLSQKDSDGKKEDFKSDKNNSIFHTHNPVTTDQTDLSQKSLSGKKEEDFPALAESFKNSTPPKSFNKKNNCRFSNSEKIPQNAFSRTNDAKKNSKNQQNCSSPNEKVIILDSNQDISARLKTMTLEDTTKLKAGGYQTGKSEGKTVYYKDVRDLENYENAIVAAKTSPIKEQSEQNTDPIKMDEEKKEDLFCYSDFLYKGYLFSNLHTLISNDFRKEKSCQRIIMIAKAIQSAFTNNKDRDPVRDAFTKYEPRNLKVNHIFCKDIDEDEKSILGYNFFFLHGERIYWEEKQTLGKGKEKTTPITFGTIIGHTEKENAASLENIEYATNYQNDIPIPEKRKKEEAFFKHQFFKKYKGKNLKEILDITFGQE